MNWNIRLRERTQRVKIIEVINETPDFKLVRLSNGEQQKLSNANFYGWRKVGPNRSIELTVRESVVRARLLIQGFQEKAADFITETLNNTNGLFFMWTCEKCQTMGYITYEDGDDSQVIRRKIEIAHKTGIKNGCDKTKFKIYDHRGMLQRESSLALTFSQ